MEPIISFMDPQYYIMGCNQKGIGESYNGDIFDLLSIRENVDKKYGTQDDNFTFDFDDMQV